MVFALLMLLSHTPNPTPTNPILLYPNPYLLSPCPIQLSTYLSIYLYIDLSVYHSTRCIMVFALLMLLW